MSSIHLISSAYNFAALVHDAQFRKYTRCPYITHCAAVAKLIAQYDLPDTWVAAALMHDCIEDADNPAATLEAMRATFPTEVVSLVLEVTDVSKPLDGNRATRKAIDRAHLAKASPGGMTIKLADLIDNTQDIVANDRDFAKVYLKEKKLLLPLLSKGDFRLYEQAMRVLQQAENRLLQEALR